MLQNLAGKKPLQFLSTPKFVADLAYLSDMLRLTQPYRREEVFRKKIAEINSELPNNVYVPFSRACSHRVLRIRSEYAFILNSKDHTPFHILLEVAENEESDRRRSGGRRRANSFGATIAEEEEKTLLPRKNSGGGDVELSVFDKQQPSTVTNRRTAADNARDFFDLESGLRGSGSKL